MHVVGIELRQAVENVDDFMECCRDDGDVADIQVALSEVIGSYPSLTKAELYEAWKQEHGFRR